MFKLHHTTAVMELNVARRADLFSPGAPPTGTDVTRARDPVTQFTSEIRYTSGRVEGPVTVQLPQGLGPLGVVERAVIAYVCTQYATGRADPGGAVTFSLHALARWIGWVHPNAGQYDRLERAVTTIALVRFIQWWDYLEPVAPGSPTGAARQRYQRVNVTSLFGFCDTADIETRAHAADRRAQDGLPSNAQRAVRLWLNQRMRQQLDAGVSVRIPLDVLQHIGLRHELAAHLYYLIASKRHGGQPVEIADRVWVQMIRPTPAWRRNLRARTAVACQVVSAADPSLAVSVIETGSGRWKIVAHPVNPVPDPGPDGGGASPARPRPRGPMGPLGPMTHAAPETQTRRGFPGSACCSNPELLLQQPRTSVAATPNFRGCNPERPLVPTARNTAELGEIR